MNLAEEIQKKIDNNEGELRAVAYARVSTGHDSQKTSIPNQLDLVNQFIAKHPNIKLVQTYIDDGISAKNDVGREQYMRMLNDMNEGKIDIIFTKALERINRNVSVANSLMTHCMITETVIFDLGNSKIIDFLSSTDRVLYQFTSIIDETVVLGQSKKGHLYQETRCANKTLTEKDISFGYDWNPRLKQITINPEQAEIVRYIFEQYVYHNATPSSLSYELSQQGYKMCSKTVTHYLKDERYIGNFYINKKGSKFICGTTKRFDLPKEEWICVEKPDLQIIDKDLFELAQRLREAKIDYYSTKGKKSKQAHFVGKHEFASKLFCSVCNRPYNFRYADTNKTIPIYHISNHSHCANHNCRVYEKDLEEIIKKAFQDIINSQTEAITELEKVLEECISSSKNTKTEEEKVIAHINKISKSIDNLIDQLSEDDLSASSKDKIKQRINDKTEEVNLLNQKLLQLQEEQKTPTNIKDKIKEIDNAINAFKNCTTVDRNLINSFIERIEVTPDNGIILLLKSGETLTLNSNISLEPQIVKTGNQDDRYSSNSTYQ